MKALAFLLLFACVAFAAPKTEIVEGPAACKGCKVIVGAVEQWVSSNKTRTEIKSLVDNLCHLFNNTMIESTCKKVTDIGVDKLIDFIEKKLNPDVICSMIGLCPKASPVVKGPVVCDGCKILIDAIHAWVNCQSTRNFIDALFDKMCLLFQKTDFQPVCENIVNYGIDQVIQFVQSELSSDKVCTKIKACPAPNPAQSVPLELELPSNNNMACSGCLAVVNGLEVIINSEKVINKIEEAAKKICVVFNNTEFYNTCNKMIEKDLPLIIKYVTNKFNADYICHKIHLCTDESRNLKKGYMHGKGKFNRKFLRPMMHHMEPLPIEELFDDVFKQFGISFNDFPKIESIHHPHHMMHHHPHHMHRPHHMMHPRLMHHKPTFTSVEVFYTLPIETPSKPVLDIMPIKKINSVPSETPKILPAVEKSASKTFKPINPSKKTTPVKPVKPSVKPAQKESGFFHRFLEELNNGVKQVKKMF